MNEQGFMCWLRKQAHRQDSIGALARGVEANILDFDELERVLGLPSRAALTGEIEAAWAEYENS